MKKQYNVKVLEMQITQQQTNHVLHLILSIITFLLWTPMWFLITISHALERGRLMRLLERIESDAKISQFKQELTDIEQNFTDHDSNPF